jgi:SAM-dependent methyltransferase
MVEYTLRQEGAEQQERARLALLEEVFDPHTIKQFDAIGVSAGWRCADVGAGAGSATRLLAQRVGHAGSVLAIDLDVRLLEPLAGGPIEVRRLNLLADPLPESTFDLVHARNLLMHLPSHSEALGRLLVAVRPGGWLALAEPDFNGLSISPQNSAWQRTWSAFCDATVAGGWDPGYGARLLNDIEALELNELHAEIVTRYAPGGSVFARLFAQTLERLTGRMQALGVTAEDLAVSQRLLLDPTITYRMPTVTTVWARRPEWDLPLLPLP